MDVEIYHLPDVQVAYLRTVGAYGQGSINHAWTQLWRWCAAHGIDSRRARMFGVCLDDPQVVAPECCRYDACVELPRGQLISDEVRIQSLAGGPYACVEFFGTAADTVTAWRGFMHDALPTIGRARDPSRPAYEAYSASFKPNQVTGEFACVLCIPVRDLP